MGVLSFWGRGIAHERRGQDCQDAIGCRDCENGSQVLVLSDGASGSKYGGEAARANVLATLSYFERVSLADFTALEPEARRTRLLSACRRELEQLRLTHEDGAPEDFCATLLFFVRDDRRWAAGHLGDGVMLLLDARKNPLLYSPPERIGSGLSTWFTAAPDAADHLRLTLGQPEEAPPELLLMMSDGPEEMFRTRGGSVRETAEELLEFVDQGVIQSTDDLSEALDQMTIYAIDRMDDWSVLIWTETGHPENGLPPQPVSMLELEERKQAQNQKRMGDEPNEPEGTEDGSRPGPEPPECL